MADTIELTIPDIETVKIKEESQKPEVKSVSLKKNWTEKLVVPIVAAVATAIIIFAFGNLTTKSLAEISRVEQKVDDFMIREQEHFDILLGEIRILRLEQGE